MAGSPYHLYLIPIPSGIVCYVIADQLIFVAWIYKLMDKKKKNCLHIYVSYVCVYTHNTHTYLDTQAQTCVSSILS